MATDAPKHNAGAGDSAPCQRTDCTARLRRPRVTLHLVRHGQSEYNVAAEPGERDPRVDPMVFDAGLTPLGVKQARGLVHHPTLCALVGRTQPALPQPEHGAACADAGGVVGDTAARDDTTVPAPATLLDAVTPCDASDRGVDATPEAAAVECPAAPVAPAADAAALTRADKCATSAATKPNVVWIVSPLSRALDTAHLALPPHVARELRVWPCVSEHLTASCDIGSAPHTLAARFPHLAAQLRALPEEWWYVDPDCEAGKTSQQHFTECVWELWAHVAVCVLFPTCRGFATARTVHTAHPRRAPVAGVGCALCPSADLAATGNPRSRLTGGCASSWHVCATHCRMRWSTWWCSATATTSTGCRRLCCATRQPQAAAVLRLTVQEARGRVLGVTRTCPTRVLQVVAPHLVLGLAPAPVLVLPVVLTLTLALAAQPQVLALALGPAQPVPLLPARAPLPALAMVCWQGATPVMTPLAAQV